MLYNKDCIDILNHLDPETVDLCVTDPPYRLIGGGNTKGGFRHGSIQDKALVERGRYFRHNDISFDEWLPAVFRVMKPGTHTYVMCNPRNLKGLWDASERAGFKFQQLIVWDKGNVLPNKFYMNAYELILMLRKGPCRYINDMGAKNIISVPSVRGKKHPTEKPVELMEILIRQSSVKGDTVLDPFMGCGSTGMACKNLGREFIGIELDEDYFEIARQRLEVYALGREHFFVHAEKNIAGTLTATDYKDPPIVCP